MALQLPVLRTPGQIVVNQHTKMHVEEEGDATMCEQASAHALARLKVLVFPKILHFFLF